MEAQRVLRRLGFVCRHAGHLDDGTPAWVAAEDAVDVPSVEARLVSLEAAVGTLEAAMAGLHTRVMELERVATGV
jgi:hypothetical protein